jgi:hypothetical protein
MEDASATSDNVTEADSVNFAEPQSAKEVDDRLTGECGLLQQLTMRLLESALEGEITDHLAIDKHDPRARTAPTPATAGAPRPC